jgi:hypothetical protein
MTHSTNSLTDMVLSFTSLYCISNVNFKLQFIIGFGSIAIAAFFGVLYFGGIEKARPLHLLFIHVSTVMGLLGVTLGIVSNSNSDFQILLIFLILLILQYFEYLKLNLIDSVLKIIPILCLVALGYFGIMIAPHHVGKNIFQGIGFIIGGRICTIQKYKFTILDEIDLFHLLLSISLYYFSISI